MNRLSVILYLLCLGSSYWAQTLPVYAEVIDKIVVMFDDDLILLSEVREGVKKPAVKVIANLEASADINQDALQYVIEQRLLLREIQYLAFPKEKDLVKSLAIQYIINTYYHNDAQAFEQTLQAQEITDAELETELTLYIKGIDYIRRKYRFNADIENPTVVLNLFQNWVKQLRTLTRILIVD